LVPDTNSAEQTLKHCCNPRIGCGYNIGGELMEISLLQQGSSNWWMASDALQKLLFTIQMVSFPLSFLIVIKVVSFKYKFINLI